MKITLIIYIFICVLNPFLYGEEFALSGNSAAVNLSGYMLSCSEPSIYIYERDKWRPAKKDLPVKGNYYIDDRFVGYGWCDNLICNPIGQPIKIDLIEFERTGERPGPGGYGPNRKFPVFKSVRLKGKIKIEISYSKNKNCKDRLVYSKIFVIE